jgi:hypothetical protein
MYDMSQMLLFLSNQFQSIILYKSQELMDPKVPF